MTKQETDEVMRKVQNWLTDEGIYRDKVADENSNYHFEIEFPLNSGRKMRIIQPKQREDTIIVLSAIRFAEQHYTGLKAKTKEERENIMWDLRFQLLFRDTEFNIIPNADDPQQIQFIRTLRFDGLTKNMLMDAISEEHKCHLFIIWSMMKLFREEPPKTQEVMYS